MKQASPNQSRPGCPPEEIWFDVASGLTPPDEELQLLMHASKCDFCGPMLRDATIVCSDGISPEEEVFLASLPRPAPPSSFTAKQKVVSIKQPAKPNSPRKFAWIAAIAAALLIAVFAGWQVYLRMNSPQVLLTKAYTARRTMELRFAGADYAPVRIERGAAVSSMDRPAALMEAEPKIKRGLDSAPYDVHLLQARAQAELLEWQFDAAIANLGRALQSAPDEVGLLIDLASANFQKGEAQTLPQHYGLALEAIMKATTLDPKNGVAWFNRAIIQQRLFLYRESIKSFEQFLQLEPSGGFATEARQHLDDLKKK